MNKRYNELNAELAALYEIANITPSISLHEIASQAKSKAVRLFGPRYFALVIGKSKTGKILSSWGFTDPVKIKEYFDANYQSSHCVFHKNCSLLMDFTAPLENREKRLIQLFALHLHRAVSNALEMKKKVESARQHKEKEKGYLDLIHSLHEAIFILDDKGFFVEMNQTVTDMCGYSKKELLGKDFTFLLAPGEKNIDITFDKEAESQSWVLCGLKKNREMFYADIVCKKGVYFDQKVTIVTARDITYQKEVEEDLVRQRNLMDAIINNAPMGIWVRDGKGKYTLVNKYFREAIGTDSGKSSITPGESKQFLQSDKKAMESNCPIFVEEELTFQDKTRHTLQIIKTGLTADNKEFLGILGLGMDITERKIIEEQLKGSESRNRAMLQALPDLLFIFDKEGHYIDVHVGRPESEKYLIAPPAQLTGKHVSSFFSPEFTQKINNNIHLCLKTGKIQTMEYELPLDNKKHYFEARLVPLGEDRVLALVRNVSELKLAEKRLTRITESFLDFVPDPIENIRRLTSLSGEVLESEYASYTVIRDKEPTLIVHWSSAGKTPFPENISRNTSLKIFNTSQDEVVVIPALESFGTKKREKSRVNTEIQVCVGKVVKRDGDPVGVLSAFYTQDIHFAPEQEKFMNIIASAIGIEEGREYYRNLLEQEKEWLQVTLQSITDGVITTDMKGKIISLNDEASNLIGIKKEKAERRELKTIITLRDAKDQKELHNPAKIIIHKGKPYNFPHTILLEGKDGTRKTIELSGAPIRNRENEIRGIVFVLRDITSQKMIEEEMIKNQKLESISTLAAGIAHDFNNLLTGVFGSIEMGIKSAGNKEKVLDHLSNALISYERAKNLTMQLMTFARGGRQVKELVFLQEILEKTMRFALSGTNISSKISCPDDLWPCKADKNQIEQVIDNILINAQQAMPGGGKVSLEARNLAAGEHKYAFLNPGTSYIKIAVKDDGAGIPQKHLNRIFDPFFTTKESGSGLGLATAYSIIQHHDGHIIVDSQPGKGSTFSIFLPAVPEGKRKPVREYKQTSRGKGRILIMDDERIILEVISQMLQDLGYETDICTDGDQVMKKYEEARTMKRPFDVVILDLTVPGKMGGKMTVQMLREQYPNIIAIASSGYSADPIMENPTKYGFNERLPKPYQYDHLNSVLEKVLCAKE